MTHLPEMGTVNLKSRVSSRLKQHTLLCWVPQSVDFATPRPWCTVPLQHSTTLGIDRQYKSTRRWIRRPARTQGCSDCDIPILISVHLQSCSSDFWDSAENSTADHHHDRIGVLSCCSPITARAQIGSVLLSADITQS